MLCKFCGGKNPEEVNFCGNCGKPLRDSPLPYKPGDRRVGIKVIIILAFLLSLVTYLSSLIFEPADFEYKETPGRFKKQIEFLKKRNSYKGKAINFSMTLSPQQMDGYLNEILLKEKVSIHTKLLKKEIEVAFSTNFLYIPTVFRIRLKPDSRKVLSVSGISIGRIPIPSHIYNSLSREYSWMDIKQILRANGIVLKEVKIDKDSLFIRGVLLI